MKSHAAMDLSFYHNHKDPEANNFTVCNLSSMLFQSQHEKKLRYELFIGLNLKCISNISSIKTSLTVSQRFFAGTTLNLTYKNTFCI